MLDGGPILKAQSPTATSLVFLAQHIDLSSDDMRDNIRGFDYDIHIAFDSLRFKTNSIEPDDENILLAYELTPPSYMNLDEAVEAVMLLWIYELRYQASMYDTIKVTHSADNIVVDATTIARSVTACSVRFIILLDSRKKP